MDDNDWRNLLRDGQRGLAVEGKDDVIALTAFLNGGEADDRWQNWASRLAIVSCEGAQNVLEQINRTDFEIWGILDRDWRSPAQIEALQAEYPRLIFLPRLMIENYVIDPNELFPLLPEVQREKLNETAAQTAIEAAMNAWLRHGTASFALQESNAKEFCGRLEGFPTRLLDPSDETVLPDLSSMLEAWYMQLAPEPITPVYKRILHDFGALSRTDHYRQCISGKEFFKQVVVQDVLNSLGQKTAAKWWEALFSNPAPCPDDLVPIFQQLLHSSHNGRGG
jgi:hypothetical protein